MTGRLDLKVFITINATRCNECGEDLGRSAWITLVPDKGPLCLACADLDHLLFLPSGNAALTRRASKYSNLSAIVLRWSRARQRYERQGLLVDAQALERAEKECLADGEARARRREREAERRQALDHQYVEQFAAQVRKLFPGCPPEREITIAEHACQKYSGRVGRSAAAKSLDAEAIRLAVIAHIRHAETHYDELLGKGVDRRDARAQVQGEINNILASWINSGKA